MKKGFALVEVMIIVCFVALLAAIAVPSFLKAKHDKEVLNGTAVENAELEKAIKEITEKSIELEKKEMTPEQIKADKELKRKTQLAIDELREKFKKEQEVKEYEPERLFEMNGYVVYRANYHGTSFFFSVPVVSPVGK